MLAWGAIATFYLAILAFWTRIVAICSTIAQRASDAPCHVHVTLNWAVTMINRLQLTSIQPILLMSTIISNLLLPPKLLTTPHIPQSAQRRERGPPWNADHRGGWTQIFGSKASEPETSRPVEKRNFYLPYLHLEPRLRLCNRNFVETFCIIKLWSPWATMRRCFWNPTFIRYETIPICDRRTNGQTVSQTDTDDSKYRVSIASRG